MGGMSSDNIHGLVLAISSSLFIGSSFIIKKKGLMKAGATGIRAGLRFPFLPLIFHFLIMIRCFYLCKLSIGVYREIGFTIS